MPSGKVTVQDLANALNLSRNTVSKVLNGTGHTTEKTRKAILSKAMELNYKQIGRVSNLQSGAPTKCITMLARSMPNKNYFGAQLFTGLERAMHRLGYSLPMYILHDEELQTVTLPVSVNLDLVDAFICTELFDERYARMLCGTGKPVIFADTYADAFREPFPADLLLMENTHSMYALVSKLAESGLRRMAFVGDRAHCLSFRERWEGFARALADHGFSPMEKCCVLEPDGSGYHDPDAIALKLRSMPELPDAFVCANDFIAIDLMRVLKAMGMRIPQDVAVTGFDDAPECEIVEPKLTTIHTSSHEMGLLAAQMLLDRIQSPNLIHHITYVPTRPVFRASTPVVSSK
ncbi:MAG: LacI family DNA-binding transcriptional regulator [Ethanoligenens sp.]